MRAHAIAFLVGALAMGAALLAAGCGGGGTDKTDPWVGTWSPTTGTLTVTCSNGGVATNPVNTPEAFTGSMTADLILVSDNCETRFDIVGDVATARAGQTCINPDGTTIRITSWTCSPQGIESSAVSISGYVDPTTNAPVTCTGTENATYTRL